jgi:hypothetical protein
MVNKLYPDLGLMLRQVKLKSRLFNGASTANE